MIGEPMLHPRDILAASLERQKAQFFAAGKSIQQIPTGLSGAETSIEATHRYKLYQAERAKLAPVLRAHADAGKTLLAAAQAMKIKWARAHLIAKENGIVFCVG